MRQNQQVDLALDPTALGTATDLYQLTMMAGYHSQGIDQSHAVFEMFVRRLPGHRSYLVCAGFEQAIQALCDLRFNREQIDSLRSWPIFKHVDNEFFRYLEQFRFTGNVWAMPEGTVAFANEPILRIEASLIQAQLVETLLLATIGYPTSVASKAARIIEAAKGREVFDFGARRGHGLASSMISARAAYLAGFDGTSQVEAARRLEIPAVGTMAHSWIQAFDHELAAFRAYATTFPGATLLVDTYEVEQGVLHAAEIEPAVHAIRIDSGDLYLHSLRARTILNTIGRHEVKIVVSGDLDEYKIADLVQREAPIDAFGVGTELINCGDAPSLALVYKLSEIGGHGRIKLSAGKQSLPFAKQVDRRLDLSGKIREDLVQRVGANCIGTPLLVPVIKEGIPVGKRPNLREAREYCRSQVDKLDPKFRSLESSSVVSPVVIDPALIAAAARLADEQVKGAGGD